MKLKVISFNLWCGGRLFHRALNFLQQEKADIMLLQEAYDGHGENLGERFRTVELFQQAFPEYSTHFAPMFLDNRGPEGLIENGQLTLSKFPLSEGRTTYFDVPYMEVDHDATTDFTQFPAGIGVTYANTDGRRVKLINNHGPVNFNGTEDDERRLNMRDVLLQEITSEGPVILAGDFNMQPQTQTIGAINLQLQNVFENKNLTTTFNLEQKDIVNFPGFATAVVDMMFITPDFKVINTECPQISASDHLPLVANLEF